MTSTLLLYLLVAVAPALAERVTHLQADLSGKPGVPIHVGKFTESLLEVENATTEDIVVVHEEICGPAPKLKQCLPCPAGNAACGGRRQKRNRRDQVVLMGNDDANVRMIKGLLHLHDIRAEAEYGKKTKERCRVLQSLCKTGVGADAIARLRKDAASYVDDYEQFVIATTEALIRWGAPSAKALTSTVIKGEARSKKKICEYSKDPLTYGVRDLKDLVRATIYVDSEDDLCKMVDMFNRGGVHKHRSPGVLQGPAAGDGQPVDPPDKDWTGPTPDELRVKVVSVKNRFQNPSYGYRDVMLNVHLSRPDDEWGHIAELQLHSRPITVAKKMWHDVYGFFRNVAEPLANMPEGITAAGATKLLKSTTVAALVAPLELVAANKGECSELEGDELQLSLWPSCIEVMEELANDPRYCGPGSGKTLNDGATLFSTFEAARDAMEKAYDNTYLHFSKDPGCASRKTFEVITSGYPVDPVNGPPACPQGWEDELPP